MLTFYSDQIQSSQIKQSTLQFKQQVLNKNIQESFYCPFYFQILIKSINKYNKQMNQQETSQLHINPSQSLKQIRIETPLNKKTLTNIPYAQAQQTLLEDVQKLFESNFYQSIRIHYGTKSKLEYTNNSLQQKICQHKKQILKLRIEEENKCIKRIMAARDPIEIQTIQTQYQKNLGLIKGRENHFDHNEFVPWIYVEAKQKKPLFGKIFQQFDRKGAAMLKATIGYRAPFSIFDRIQFKMETLPIQYLKKRKYYVFDLNWMKPIEIQNLANSQFFVTTQNSCSPIFKTIDQKKTSAGVGLTTTKGQIQFEVAQRHPIFFDKIYENCRKDWFRPSRKVSMKVNKTFIDTIERGDITTGKYFQNKMECTVPFISQSNFVKFDLIHRQFYDIYWFGNYFRSQKIKNLFKNSNLETNFNIKTTINPSNYVSDFPQKFEVRGFQNDRSPDQSIAQAKASFKFNNYNYPVFGGVGIVPFLYGQAGMSINKQIKKSHILGSAGIGVSYPLSKFINIQILYALCQGQNYSKRQPVNFQIRIGFMD